MIRHYGISLTQRLPLVLLAHAIVKEVAQHTVSVYKRHATVLGCLHNPYAPVHISGITIIGIVWDVLSNLPKSEESLMTNHHTIFK
jgi:hypothetical protein